MKKYTHPEMRSKFALKDYFLVNADFQYYMNEMPDSYTSMLSGNKADFQYYMNEMPDSYISMLCSIFAFHSGNMESNPFMQMIEVFVDHKGVTGRKENIESNPLMQMIEVFADHKGVTGWKENYESLHKGDS